MTKAPISLSLALVLAMVACSTPEPSPMPTVTEEPPTATLVPPTEPPTATQVPPTQPPTATQEPPTLTPEPSISETISEGDSANEVTVIVVDSSYRLRVITVAVGTTVTWEYNAGLPHTVTSDTNLFNSGTMGEGETFSYTFDEAGMFPYFCRFHGGPGGNGMSGVVNVTEG